MLSSGGDTVFVGRNLTDGEALKISVQLSHALVALRAALATGAERVASGPMLGGEPQSQELVD